MRALASIVVLLAGCSSSPEAATAPAPPPDDRIERLAYAEMKALSKRTCAAIPRRVLHDSLAAVSGDRRTAAGPGDDNGIALLYAEDVKIQDLALQRAAYDGCLAGLESRR